MALTGVAEITDPVGIHIEILSRTVIAQIVRARRQRDRIAAADTQVTARKRQALNLVSRVRVRVVDIDRLPGRIAGRITSIAPRSTLGYALGMAFVEPDMAAAGTPVEIRLGDGSICQAEVAALPFYDADDQRQKL